MKDLRDRTENLSETLLDYKPEPFPASGKVIHDAVWGSIQLRSHESVLLDCSLLQRLRYLHQTGFAFLTYPSARHTRFEHSLGVVRQTDHHLNALSSRFRGYVTEEAVSKLRLAALLHDCSHGMFSHTSEEIYRFLPDMLFFTGDKGEYKDHKASELLARFMLESKALKKMMDFFAEKKVPTHTTGKELALLVAGDQKAAYSPHDRWMFDVINGPLDTDKLDYIARDGLHTGIPLSVDLDRFWLATEILPLKKGCLKGIEEDETRLVINRSGINAVEGILFARFQLTNSVYHHHKIRSCDCWFRSWIENKQAEGKFVDTLAFITASDLDFLVEVRNWKRDHMLSRAMVISRDTAELSDEFWQLVIVSHKSFETAQKLRDLAKLIAEKANLPKELCGYVWVDLPPLPKVDDLAATIVNLARPPGKNFEYLGKVFPVEEWKLMYLDKKWKGHVFAPVHYVDAVEKAARKLLPEYVPGFKLKPAN